ncbi:hypothetical protein FRC20_002178 [Serendipita sp. 405]|nr:hypothetical protein FRC20_002178 [Serendipita sp. 405]
MSEQTGVNQSTTTQLPPYSPTDPSPTAGTGTRVRVNHLVGESSGQEVRRVNQRSRPLPQPFAGTGAFVETTRAQEMLRRQQERQNQQQQQRPADAPNAHSGAEANVRRGAPAVAQTSPPAVNTVNAHRHYPSYPEVVETRQISNARHRAINQPEPLNTAAARYPPPGFPPPGSPPAGNHPNNRPTHNPRSRSSSAEDLLLQLVRYDTVIIVDDSLTMAGTSWSEAREALSELSDLAGSYDTDGIDLYFLNSPLVGNGLRNAQEVGQLFDSVVPYGITPIGEKLEILLLDYLSRLETAKRHADVGEHSALAAIKPVNYLVITDGAPIRIADDPEPVIVAAARRLDEGKFPITQVGIQFVQIGSDPSATEALRGLDDDLPIKYGIRDIVDTTLYSGHQLDASTLTKCLLGGINRRIDRRGVS